MTVAHAKKQPTLNEVKQALAAEGMSADPLINFLSKMEKQKQNSAEIARKVALATNGFVSVKQRTLEEVANNGGEPIMYGLYVEGNQPSGYGTIARILQADSRAPEWFQKAVSDEETNPTGIEFRVRVGGISTRGRTAYVWPIARSLEQAKAEWKREKKARDNYPKSVAECGGKDLLANLVYRHYADVYDLIMIRFDPSTNQALMVEKKDTTFLYLVSGAASIWDFTDGITKGFTSLSEEIERAVKCKAISRG